MNTYTIKTEYQKRATGEKGKKVFTLKRKNTQGALFVVYTWAKNNNADLKVLSIKQR